MSTVDTCTTPEEGWGLVHHFLGNILLVVRIAVSDKKDGWESVVSDSKMKLVSHLEKIAKRMSDYGHSEDSEKIGGICRMVKEYDLTDLSNIDAIHAKNLEYSASARAMKVKVQKFGNR